MSFNLNISNYTISEIEELLNLTPPYTLINIKQNSNLLINNIKNNTKIDEPLKQSTIQFLQSCINILINNPTSNNKLSNNNKNLIEDTIINPHPIITKPQTPYLMSYPQEYFNGQLNPLHKRVIKKILNIDTRFRDNYITNVATNCSILLPMEFKNVVNMQLMSIEIPNTFYTISEQYNNNYFNIVAGNEKIIYTIPDGIYTNTDLVDFLNNYAANNGITSTNSPLLYNMSFTININNDLSTTGTLGESGSGQFIIGINPNINNTNPPFNFIVNFMENIDGNPDFNTPINLKFGWLLGFRSGVYSGNSVYISEGIIDLYGPKYGFLSIDDYNNNVNNGFYSAFTQSILNKNILSRITFPNQNSKTFNIINHNNMNLITYPRQYFGPVDIHKLNIQLLDEYGRILNLNNMDFSFCLSFDTIYDL